MIWNMCAKIFDFAIDDIKKAYSDMPLDMK